MLRRAFAIAVAVLTGVSVAQAAVMDIHWEPVDGDPAVPNSVQNTLFAAATTDWLATEVNFQLTSGSILNPVVTDPEVRLLGGDNDTWLAVPTAANGAFPTIQVFDEDFNSDIQPFFPRPNQTFIWFDTADNGGFDGSNPHARIYASDDANGIFRATVFDSDTAGVGVQLNGFVVNGEFTAIPEPASIALLGLATVAGLVTIRRKLR